MPLSLRYLKSRPLRSFYNLALLPSINICITIFFRQRTIISLTADKRTASTTISLATRLSDWIKRRRQGSESGYTPISDDLSPPVYPSSTHQSEHDAEPFSRVVKSMENSNDSKTEKSLKSSRRGPYLLWNGLLYCTSMQ